ncbi:ATPase [Colletotrichum kahawae]|uniref:ATPase n=1 Tax=Colletotrichum kahawae TaxID=34407 RepID=A0AAD9Y299_COLKA|nr:ATPase [Colletotrichum kahawae]
MLTNVKDENSKRTEDAPVHAQARDAETQADFTEDAKKETKESVNKRRIIYRKKVTSENGPQGEEPYEPDDKLESPHTEIKIESEAARKILQENLKHYPGYHWDNSNLSVFSPFEPFIHNLDVLEEASKADSDGARDLAEILDAAKKVYAVDAYLKTRNATIEEEIRQGEQEKVKEKLMSFDILWSIFKPGEFIFMPNSFIKQRQVFILHGASYIRTVKNNKISFVVTGWVYDWNGSSRTFDRVCVEVPIEKFQNQRPITTLPCYPLSYFKGDANDLRTKLIERGKKFRQLCISPPGKQMFDYEGMARVRAVGFRHLDGIDQSDDSSQVKVWLLTVQQMIGKVMVDFDSYARYGPDESIPMGDLTIREDEKDDECRCPKCEDDNGPGTNQRYDWDEVKESDAFDDDQFFICPPRVLGYHLAEKKWVELLVDHVKDINDNQTEDAFAKLQLVDRQKSLIRDLVQSHAAEKNKDFESPRGFMGDLMEGKGEGLVILLHDSVAQCTSKPLFLMGVADITTDPSVVERRLEQLFELAASWQAVMLFIRSFDIAVQSRINLAIQFENLKEEQKIAIFDNLINRIPEKYIENKSSLRRYLQDNDEAASKFDDLNGRQVRNVVFSAASLAGNRPQGENFLRKSDVERMLNETWNFHRHLHELTKSAREKNE